VRSFGHADVERHLGILVHGTAAAAASRSRRDPTIAPSLAGFRIAVIDGGVLVDLLAVDAGAEPVRPFAIPRLAAQVHRAHVRVAVDLPHDVFTEGLGRLNELGLPWIAYPRQVGVPAARRP